VHSDSLLWIHGWFVHRLKHPRFHCSLEQSCIASAYCTKGRTLPATVFGFTLDPSMGHTSYLSFLLSKNNHDYRDEKMFGQNKSKIEWARSHSRTPRNAGSVLLSSEAGEDAGLLKERDRLTRLTAADRQDIFPVILKSDSVGTNIVPRVENCGHPQRLIESPSSPPTPSPSLERGLLIPLPYAWGRGWGERRYYKARA